MINFNKKEIYISMVILTGLLIAIGIQILAMIHVGSTMIRVAVADMLAPIGAILIATKYFSSGMTRPNWITPNIDLLLFAFLVLLGASCIMGWLRTETFIAWAWGPKFIGFSVLILYFLMGTLLSETSDKSTSWTLSIYLYTSWIIASLSLLRFFVEVNGALPFGHMAWRPVGFSNNPNAFAFLLATAALIQVFTYQPSSNASKLLSTIGLAAIISTLFLIGSRSVYLGLILATPAIFYFRKYVKWKIIAFSLGVAPLLIYFSTKNFELFYETTNLAGLEPSALAQQSGMAESPLQYATRSTLVVDHGVAARLETMWIALDLWREAPIFGIGLGSFMHHYAEITGGIIFALHTSGLWLLVETGIVGLILFAAIVGLFLLGLHRRAVDHQHALSASLFVILIFSLGASIGTEIIYQRQLWFLLGLAASYPSMWRNQA